LKGESQGEGRVHFGRKPAAIFGSGSLRIRDLFGKNAHKNHALSREKKKVTFPGRDRLIERQSNYSRGQNSTPLRVLGTIVQHPREVKRGRNLERFSKGTNGIR